MDDATVVYEEVKPDFFDNPAKKAKNTQQKTPQKSRKKSSSKSKKTKGLKLEYNAPISLTFCFLSFFSFAFLSFLAKEDFLLFSCPTKQGTALAFSAKNILHYVRLFTYVFGSSNLSQLLFSTVFILLLGPTLETNYGSKLFFIMIVVSTFSTGILGSCFSPVSLTGSSSIIFMITILSTYTAIEKKKVPLTLLLTCLVFVVEQIASFVFTKSSPLPVLFYLVGGLLGCLFGFLATPIKRTK